MRRLHLSPVACLRGCTLATMTLAMACSPGAETHSTRLDTDAFGYHVVEDAEIGIEEYIQIDDKDGTGPSAHDANHCGPATNGVAAAAAVCPNAYIAADNRNFPGPDPSLPDTLGADADYIDWGDLLAVAPGVDAPHFLLDADTQAGDDDIFQVGSCIATGHSPNKANLTFTGVAANDTWLYLMSERETTNGSEKHHYLFTQLAPSHEDHPDCDEPTWVWDMREGDVMVELSFQSTASLAEAVVDIWRWSAPDQDDVLAEDVLLAPNWTAIPPAATPPAYTAYNVAFNRNKSPTEDDENSIEGPALASGQLAEIAIDIEQVFGVGCGLRRTMAVISTASASPNGQDDLKDFQEPVALTTGELELELELAESCDEGFDWSVSALLGEEDLIGDPDIALEIQYNCGNGDQTIAVSQASGFEPVLGGGSCTATLVAKDGTGRLAGCDASSDADLAETYPPLDVAAILAQADCGEDFSYEATPSGGAPPYSVDWTFTGPSAIAGSALEDGSAGITGIGTITGAVTVTDSRYAALGCSDGDEDDTPVYPEIAANLFVESGVEECFDDDIPVTPVITGGSGVYTLDWTLTDLDGTNDATTSCVDGPPPAGGTCGFNLGDEVCAEAKLELSVSDPVCGNPFPVSGTIAERTSTTSISAL